MVKIDHTQLEKMVEKTDRLKTPMVIKGDTGIGKSDSVKRKSRELAEKEGREYEEWNALSAEERKAYCTGEVDYDEKFLLIDKRLAESDPSDVKGVPDLEGDFTEWKPSMWVNVITRENLRGVLFLDEFNHAPKLVQSSFYSLVLDREICGKRISEDLHVIGAGNRVEDSSSVTPMPDPLSDRFVNVTLEVPEANMDKDKKDWANWAVKNDIDHRIVSFLSSDVGREQIHRRAQDSDDSASDAKLDEEVFPTPRSWAMASDLIEDMNVNDPLMETYVESCVGRTAAQQFMSYVKTLHNLDINKYIHDPDKATELNQKTSIDKLCKMLTAIGQKMVDPPKKQGSTEVYSEGEIVNRIIDIGMNLEQAEHQVLLYRIAKMTYNGENDEKWENLVINECPDDDKLQEQLGKLVI